VKGALVLGLAVQGQEQAADARMRSADACLSIALPALVLTREAIAGSSALEGLLDPGRRL
jgi:hypothetical protein